MKDIALLSQLKTPVRIILCGNDVDVNEDYLNIAYKTGGSIHHMQSDLINLASMTEGSKVKIRGHNYMLLNGKFVLIK